MKNKVFALCLMTTLAIGLTGCIEGVDDRSHAAVPFIKNKVEGNYERSVKQVLDAGRAVLKFNGQLVADNTVNNSLEGKINQVTVWIKVDEIDAAKPVSRVQVQTRNRGGGPDIDLAHEVEKQIALQLAAH